MSAGTPNRPRTATPATLGRVLVVGEPSLAQLVRDVLFEAEIEGSVDVVGDYLMALGDAKFHAPSAIVGRVRGLEEMLDATVAGFHRIAPDARLILIARPHEEPEALRAIEAGFHEYLIEPTDPDELLAALSSEEIDVTPTPAPAKATPEPVIDPVSPAPKLAVPVTPKAPPAPAAPPTMKEAFAPRAAEPEPPPPLRMTPPLAETPAPAAASPGPAPGSGDGELGDIDLVEQMLHDRTHVRDLALRLIASQTGWRDVACVADASQVTPGYAAAPVELNGKRFGLLSAAAPAGAADLAAWAAWLSRWLALETQVDELHEWAFKDDLTGVCSRRYFNQFLERIIQRAIRERFRVTLMLFDIDNFKSYNDRFGHAAGDDILRETARLMQSVVRPHDVVARIGGDEFAVIFWDADEPRKPNSQHPDSVRTAAERFQKAICAHRFPKLAEKAPGTLTISGGLAGFPWDGRTPAELLELADQRAMQSKRQGKNVITFGPGVDAGCSTEEKARRHEGT